MQIAPELRGSRILVVDDEPNIVEMLDREPPLRGLRRGIGHHGRRSRSRQPRGSGPTWSCST